MQELYLGFYIPKCIIRNTVFLHSKLCLQEHLQIVYYETQNEKRVKLEF